jgi:hypothetical protein
MHALLNLALTIDVTRRVHLAGGGQQGIQGREVR